MRSGGGRDAFDVVLVDVGMGCHGREKLGLAQMWEWTLGMSPMQLGGQPSRRECWKCAFVQMVGVKEGNPARNTRISGHSQGEDVCLAALRSLLTNHSRRCRYQVPHDPRSPRRCRHELRRQLGCEE